jgi:hypothetical protein
MYSFFHQCPEARTAPGFVGHRENETGYSAPRRRRVTETESGPVQKGGHQHVSHQSIKAMVARQNRETGRHSRTQQHSRLYICTAFVNP